MTRFPSTKEKELEMGKEDLAGKPDAIKEKIVAGTSRSLYACRMPVRRHLFARSLEEEV